jgi:hypothetical protein
VPDLEVRKHTRQLPALAAEEVGPAVASDAQVAAPQELFAGGKRSAAAIFAPAAPAAAESDSDDPAPKRKKEPVKALGGGARGSAAGVVKADEELSRAELRARRARKKRKGMGAAAGKAARLAAFETARLARREAQEKAGFAVKDKEKGGRGGAAPAGRSEFGRSSKVFARLQEGAEAAKATAGQRVKAKAKEQGVRASAFKL